MAIRRGTHTENFTVLPNELINDNSLSLEARGMLILLLSKPAGWQISNAGLVAMLESGPHTVGRDLVARMLREIVAAGYMVRSQEQLPDGTFGPTDYEVHSVRYGWDADQPLTAKPSTVQPSTVKPLQESNVLEPKKEMSLRKKREAPAIELTLNDVTDEHRQLALDAGVDLKTELAKYCDRQATLPASERHRDQKRGFNNWLRRAPQFAPKADKREAVSIAIWGDKAPALQRKKTIDELLAEERTIEGSGHVRLS